MLKPTEIRAYMDRNYYGSRFVEFLRHTFIVREIHKRQGIFPDTPEHMKVNQKCYKAHSSEISKLREILHDDYSKALLDALIEYKTKGEFDKFATFIHRNQYFDPSIVKCSNNEVFVDGGRTSEILPEVL